MQQLGPVHTLLRATGRNSVSIRYLFPILSFFGAETHIAKSTDTAVTKAHGCLKQY